MPIARRVRRSYTCDEACRSKKSEIAKTGPLAKWRQAVVKSAKGGKVVIPKKGSNTYIAVRAIYNKLLTKGARGKKATAVVALPGSPAKAKRCHGKNGKFVPCAVAVTVQAVNTPAKVRKTRSNKGVKRGPRKPRATVAA